MLVCDSAVASLADELLVGREVPDRSHMPNLVAIADCLETECGMNLRREMRGNKGEGWGGERGV